MTQTRTFRSRAMIRYPTGNGAVRIRTVGDGELTQNGFGSPAKSTGGQAAQRGARLSHSVPAFRVNRMIRY